MEEMYILRKDSVNIKDPHGYVNAFSRTEANYKSPTKRSFLSECIRQIHIMNGNDMPMISMPVEYNKVVIWSKLNYLMRPSRITPYQAAVQRVKRRLFREPKLRQRKCQNPKYNDSNFTDSCHFKASRHELGIKKIPRNYLDQARRFVETGLRQNLKRKYMDDHDEESDIESNPLHFNTNEGVFQVSQQVISKVCRYHGNMARHHPQRERSAEEQFKRERNTEACRLSRRARKLEEVLVDQQYRQRLHANNKILEASIRSILYMKTLMGLMVGHTDERNVYV
ncbi:uncharacterized protein LOC111678364 [Lucilia cuprina]|uniref:uncharacterized protein LOC111678364 n=1 Tax=Lucilia cuprina TaxID=7375 RepID=UPI001F06DEF1|nr:uncharacterized protein LOC111678364 [Lucilia cuprina]